MRDKVRMSGWSTQIASSCAAICVGRSPTRIAATTLFEPGSMTATELGVATI
jgi:hypothetical protein